MAELSWRTAAATSGLRPDVGAPRRRRPRGDLPSRRARRDADAADHRGAPGRSERRRAPAGAHGAAGSRPRTRRLRRPPEPAPAAHRTGQRRVAVLEDAAAGDATSLLGGRAWTVRRWIAPSTSRGRPHSRQRLRQRRRGVRGDPHPPPRGADLAGLHLQPRSRRSRAAARARHRLRTDRLWNTPPWRRSSSTLRRGRASSSPSRIHRVRHPPAAARWTGPAAPGRHARARLRHRPARCPARGSTSC